MGLLVWTMMGLAIWHFAVYLPDRFWGGIVGAFLGAVTGAILFGLVISGFSVPGRDDTSLLTALEAVPGALLGIAAVYFLGVRREPSADSGPGGLRESPADLRPGAPRPSPAGSRRA